MHSKQVLEYIFFEANLSSKNVSKPITLAQSDERGMQYTDECVDLPSSMKSLEKQSNSTETLLGMTHAEFRYLQYTIDKQLCFMVWLDYSIIRIRFIAFLEGSPAMS